MGMLRSDDAAQLAEIFEPLTEDVTLHLWSDDLELRMFIDDVAATATGKGKIKVEKVDEERARELGIDKSPGMALTAARAKGKLFFYGHPVGYEMATLLSAILDLGGPEEPTLSDETTGMLAEAPDKIHIQVFSTPG